MRLSLRPSSIPPSATDVFETVRGLRAELEAVTDAEQRALLLHEIGVLEELHRDDHAAAKDLLGAVNSATSLREPLEHLLALVERRHSFQNLGKLLDRLGRVVTEPQEIARAQLARGDFSSDHRNDPEAARQAYALAEQTGVLSQAVWLSQELLGRRLEDPDLALAALVARAKSTSDPTYRAALQLRAARAALAAGEEPTGLSLLRSLAAADGPSRYDALSLLEEHESAMGSSTRVAELRETRARLLAESLERPELAPHPLEPHTATAAATELWLRAAHLQRALGRGDRGLHDLAQAERLLANNPAVLFAAIDAHAELGNWAEVSRAVRSLLEIHDLKGSGKASVLARAAEAEANLGRDAEALLLLRQALEADSHHLMARAMQLHLLLERQDLEHYAEALEAVAHNSTDEASRARYFGLAALAWSQTKGNSEAARAALLQSADAGIAQRTAGRWARLLSVLCRDPHWERDATERLLEAGEVEEHYSARLQLARSAWLRGDSETAQRALTQLSTTEHGAWLGAMLRAYPPAAVDAESNDVRDDGVDALSTLAAVSPAEERRALLQIVALRHHRARRLDLAREVLGELHSESPADVAIAQQLAHVRSDAHERLDAARVLSESGDACSDPDVAAALKLQAGILAWMGGDRKLAVSNFESASRDSSAASSGLLHWALRAAEPDSPAARSKALQAGLDSNGDVDVYALERFALGLGSAKTQPEKATEGLDAADEVSLGESGEAVQLARALWPRCKQHPAALRHLESQSECGEEIARALRFLEEKTAEKPDLEKLTELAGAWARSGSTAGLLEWLSHGMAQRNTSLECQARDALAAHLDGDARACLDAGTALVRYLAEATAPDLLDSPHPAAARADLETSPPGCDPRRRALALAGVGHLLDDEDAAMSLALSGYNELLAQKPEAAMASFRAVVKAFPSDVFGWEGLRLAAQQLEDRRTEAEACSRLGHLTDEPLLAARFFRNAATLLLDDLHDEPVGRTALRRAVELDISHKGSFKRWYAVLRERNDDPAIVELLERRIQITNDASELIGLYWDRARSYRKLEQLDAALEELDNLDLLDSAHVGARALRGEIYIRQNRFAEAAAQLSELASMPAAPDEQRLMSGIAAVDLYEDRLHDLSKALDVLDALHAAGLETLAVRERLARATAKAKRWDDAARLLEELLVQRQTSAGRVDAARLLMAIYRDQLQQPERAAAACEALLDEAPTDPEAIDFVLEGSLDDTPTDRLLQRIATSLLRGEGDELDEEQLARAARVAEHLDDLSLRQAALGALVTLGVNDDDMRRELHELDHRSHRHPQVVVSAEQLAELLAPADDGPFSQLFALLGPHLPEVFGPTLKTLGVGRRQRQKPPAGADLRAEIAAFTGAFGLGDFELYQGGPDPDALVAVADDKLPAFVLGANVTTPLNQRQRWNLAQQVLGLLRGTSLLLQRDNTEGAALAAAACAVAKHPLPGPSFAMLGEFTRALERSLPRRVRKELAELAAEIQQQNLDPRTYVQAARASLDRAAAIAIGDISWVVLDRNERQTQERNFDPQTEHRVRALIRFVLSDGFMRLRQQLGMAPQ